MRTGRGDGALPGRMRQDAGRRLFRSQPWPEAALPGAAGMRAHPCFPSIRQPEALASEPGAVRRGPLRALDMPERKNAPASAREPGWRAGKRAGPRPWTTGLGMGRAAVSAFKQKRGARRLPWFRRELECSEIALDADASLPDIVRAGGFGVVHAIDAVADVLVLVSDATVGDVDLCEVNFGADVEILDR